MEHSWTWSIHAAGGIADDWKYGRRCPEAYNNMCATSSGIRFVTVNHQPWSTAFSITTWSLCDDDYTWREEATLDAGELWALDPENRLPDVLPEFPAVNMENPDAICFSLNDISHPFDYGCKIWMVEVDMKKKVLLAVTAYSKEQSLPGDGDTIKSARIRSQGYSFISSELPRYLYGGEGYKKRRQ
jgi:hypothetical protein